MDWAGSEGEALEIRSGRCWNDLDRPKEISLTLSTPSWRSTRCSGWAVGAHWLEVHLLSDFWSQIFNFPAEIIQAVTSYFLSSKTSFCTSTKIRSWRRMQKVPPKELTKLYSVIPKNTKLKNIYLKQLCKEVLFITIRDEKTYFWDVTSCSLVEVYQCFRGTYCLHFHRRWTSQASNKQEASRLLDIEV
jgi:hypothetical protein